MKKVILLIVLLSICLSITGCSGKERDNKKFEEVFEAYIQCIKDYVSNTEYDAADRIRYTLVYINEDDIPELAISEGNSHASGVRVYFYDFDRRETVDTGERYGENGGFDYYDRKSMIYDYYFGNGGFGNVCFCNISEYKATRSRWFTYYGDTSGKDHYWIDFEEVSKEEYEKAYQEDTLGFADADIVRVGREDMEGTYQNCNGENAVKSFFEIMDLSKKSRRFKEKSED